MEATATVWEAARDGADQRVRDDLMMQHIRLVYHVARQVIRSTSVDAELDELVSAGTIGLMNAIDNFDPSRGLAFSTFAAPRIRGSVLDDLRRRDHATRSLRKKERDIARARERLQAELGRTPTDQEMADGMDVDLTTFWRWRRETEQVTRVSLDRRPESSNGTAASPRDTLVGDDGTHVVDRIAHEEEIGILREEIMKLKEQERLVLSLYYFEELKLHEIATVLGVTESRVSQIRSKAITNLRKRIGHLRVG
jgi:RNA polymerase sigma factor for flagellar operon FliA